MAGMVLGVAAPLLVALMPFLGPAGVLLGAIGGLSLVLSPAWLAIIFMSLVDIHKVRRWRSDHRAFLASYERH